ncbi:MAG: hypothetical protein LH679_12710 [Cyanobacteria bacterium CAN_BIN43]|nr:hypothetical protein [Cyanobacteria bacterium CAN_BIN43]
MSKERQINPRSLENLKLGKARGDKTKIRFNTTLLPETITWLKACGNASDTIDALITERRHGNFKCTNDRNNELQSDNTHKEKYQEIEALRVEAEQLRLQLKKSSPSQCLEVTRDHPPAKLDNLNDSKLEPLSQRQLAKRLSTSHTTVGRHQEKQDFINWSQELDPDQVGWRFDPKSPKSKQFHPVNC